MRLLLVVVSALVALARSPLTHGLHHSSRALATYPACTANQTKAFTDNLSTASDGCTNSSSYDWDGDADPTPAQRTALCNCTVATFSVPKCYWTKLPKTNVNTTDHFKFVYNCSSINGKVTPNVTEVDAASYTATASTETPTSTNTTDTPKPTTSTLTSSAANPTNTPSKNAMNLSDCTAQQLNAFSETLFKASSQCMGGSLSWYNWGGNANPIDAQYKQICKCKKVDDFDIPNCSVQKGPDIVSLPEHYVWVTKTECPKVKLESSSNVGMIAGIAGAVVVVVLIIGFLLLRRYQKNKDKQPEQLQYQAGSHAMPSPSDFQPIGMTPRRPRSRKNTDSRPSEGGRTTVSTSNDRTGSLSADTRLTETASWDDPAIMAVRIPLDSVFFGTLLNRGGFGEVYRGTYRGEPVAIKQLLPARRKDLTQIGNFLGEVKLMSALDHERVVKFIGVAWNSLSDACMVIEFMENGDLRSVLGRWDSGAEIRQNGFDADKIKIALHIAHALVYLHSLQPMVVHRDLKSSNILLDANMDAKLTDFGISRERAESTMTAGVGSSLWMAPEVMMGNRYDEKADIFAFGVVLSELDTHQLPYFHYRESGSGQSIPEAAILQQVMLGRVTVCFTERADPELVRLGRECVRLNPRDRPTTAMVLHRVHQVMQGWHQGMAL